jgi:branched-chain amino acid transport system substrate-binding protein
VERNSVAVASAVKTLVAAKPDAIVQIGAYKACAAFIRAARAAGFGGTFFNVSFVGTQALADELGKGAAGVVVSQVMPSPYSAARPDRARVHRGGEEGGRRLPGQLLQHGGLPGGQGAGRGPEARPSRPATA